MLRPLLCCAALAVALPPSARAELPASSGFNLDGMAPQSHWGARLTLLGNGYTQRFDDTGRTVDFDTGADGLALMPEVARIEDLATLRAVRDAVRPARTVDDIRAVYRRAAA